LTFWTIPEVWAEELERDRAFEFRIERLVNRAHAALPDLGEYFGAYPGAEFAQDHCDSLGVFILESDCEPGGISGTDLQKRIPAFHKVADLGLNFSGFFRADGTFEHPGKKILHLKPPDFLRDLQNSLTMSGACSL
jgi:hypothetical protein